MEAVIKGDNRLITSCHLTLLPFPFIPKITDNHSFRTILDPPLWFFPVCAFQFPGESLQMVALQIFMHYPLTG